MEHWFDITSPNITSLLDMFMMGYHSGNITLGVILSALINALPVTANLKAASFLAVPISAALHTDVL